MVATCLRASSSSLSISLRSGTFSASVSNRFARERGPLVLAVLVLCTPCLVMLFMRSCFSEAVTFLEW